LYDEKGNITNIDVILESAEFNRIKREKVHQMRSPDQADMARRIAKNDEAPRPTMLTDRWREPQLWDELDRVKTCLNCADPDPVEDCDNCTRNDHTV
jgi:hypothetical protein